MAKKKEEEVEEVVEEVEEDAKPLDETIPGGAYEVDGKLVNAEGQPITKTGKVKE